MSAQQEVKMSEQVKLIDELREAAGDHAHGEGYLAGLLKRGAAAINALHAEAEALRAENGRLTKDCSAEMFLTMTGEVTRLRAELEAARGLLRECHAEFDTCEASDFEVRMRQRITAFLTATPAPEALAEQGERQEAVAEVVQREPYEDGTPNPCKTLAWSLDNCEDDLPTGTKLYTTPQPGPDVRGLVEALEHARLFIRNGVELCYVKMPDSDTPDPAHETLPKIEAALAAHRLAQQGGSHDT